MKILRTAAQMQSWSQARRAKRLSIGFVPTMGALHEGHLSLVHQARLSHDAVVVSIFVNPTQFGPQEDFARYPRPLREDLALLRRAGVEAAFVPGVRDIYPDGFATRVRVPALAMRWEGEFRPGHFEGVSTVVARLFGLVQPQAAYFGEKDFQQLRIIQRMTQDLALPVRIVPCRTHREPDGLAMSSRNRYLSKTEREEAVKLFQALYLGQELVAQGVMKTPAEITKRLKQVLVKIPRSRIEYVALVDPQTLEPKQDLRGPIRLLAALRLGKTRLIDNVEVTAPVTGRWKAA